MTALGNRYRLWEPGVPRIPQTFLDSVFYLYRTGVDAYASANVGGTGFIVGVPVGERDEQGLSNGHLFLVSNAHVVCEGDDPSPIPRLNLKDGGFDVLDGLTVDSWVPHPMGDDIAVHMLDLEAKFRFSVVTPDEFLSRDDIDKYGPGDETFSIGLYAEHEGVYENTPSVRFGNISMYPERKVFNKRRGFLQDTILVESRTLGGFSGSPIFAYIGAHMYWDEKVNYLAMAPTARSRVSLLGITWGYHYLHEDVRDPDTGEPLEDGTYVCTNSGMSHVIPAWKILEAINQPKVMTMRKQAEEEWSDHAKRSRSQEASARTDDAPFTRDDFLSDLTKATERAEPQDREG